VVLLLLVCCGLVGASVAFAGSAALPRMTEAQKSQIKLDLTNAVAVEHIALTEIKAGKDHAAEGTLKVSETALQRVKGVLVSHDLGGGQGVEQQVFKADLDDTFARVDLSEPHLHSLARIEVDKAITAKNWALHLLPRIPTQENPTPSTMAVCAFTIASGEEGVEVKATPGQTGGVNVSDASGATTDLKTFVVPASGLAVVAPLTAPTTGSFKITIFVGSQKTTLTEQAGGTPATTCTPVPVPTGR